LACSSWVGLVTYSPIFIFGLIALAVATVD
jgi:hypothetical protein